LSSTTTHRLSPHQISRPYLIINWTFAVIFGGIVVYSALFDPERGNQPLPSAYQLMTGEETISTGLSRSFSALVRFRFDEAREFNPYGPRIFLYFAVELLLRIAILFILLRGKVLTGRESSIKGKILTERELLLRDKLQNGNKLQVRDRLQTKFKFQAGKWLIFSDAAQSLLLFIFCFWPFLAYWTNLLQIG